MTTVRDNILQRYRRGGKAIRMERTSKKPALAHYVRVSVKDEQAAKPKADLSKLSDEEIRAGVYIPTHERFFRNPPDDDPSLAEFYLADYLRHTREEVKRSKWKKK